MSFSYEIKSEVARLDSVRTENITELSAIIRNSAKIDKSIIITIENSAIARRIFKLIKDIYDITPVITVRKRYSFNKGLSYILDIKEKNEQILKDLSILDEQGNYLNIPKDYIIEDEEEVRAYLRGLFMCVGSINDPKTSRYHLELLVDNLKYAKFISQILNKYNLNSKVIKREKNYMIYIKEAEKIADFLRIIKSFNAVMYFEDIRIYRDHKNMTNRLNNCEQANMDKVFMTSNSQIKDIQLLETNGLLDILDEKLKEVINYRLQYPESSLQELSDIITIKTGNKITKSGLNHRLRKIKEIANRLKNN
ncbi:putative sporulation transcription regulator WhiA [Clostridium sp. CAG:762]|jgi:DNA-binding protein WhiA|nr:putative sporulation transcription regulator WhiA [Clostridium sp. CAG:762]